MTALGKAGSPSLSPPSPQIPALWEVECGRNGSGVIPTSLLESLEMTRPPNHKAALDYHRKGHGCVFQVQVWNFYRPLSLQISPRPQVQEYVVGFPISTERICPEHQSHLKLCRIPENGSSNRSGKSTPMTNQRDNAAWASLRSHRHCAVLRNVQSILMSF